MFRGGLRFLIVALPIVFFSACAPIGIENIGRDRVGYAQVYADSWKHQVLLNMVKLRYADTPVFLEVNSIITQYLITTQINGRLTWNEYLPGDSQAIGGIARYAERPTITFQPLTGEKFTRSLMRPLDPSAILSLIQRGWQADLVLRICVDSINGINNRESASLEIMKAHPDFYRIAEMFLKIQHGRALDLRVNKTGENKETTVLIFRQKGIDAATQRHIADLKKLLGLNPALDEFNVVYGTAGKDDKEIAFLSRSMLDIFKEMANYIEVPQTDVTEKRVTANLSRDADVQAGVKPLMCIHSSCDKKIKDAFVSVPYRGNLFWIDDRDYQSKRFFTFIMFLLTLAETDVPSQAPVITIPAG